MAEFTNANTVSVAAGQNVPLTETAVAGKGCVVHREGAAIMDAAAAMRGAVRIMCAGTTAWTMGAIL